MVPKRVPYYFGRLNLIFAGRDKLEVLRAALDSGAMLEVRGQRWGFYEFRELEASDGPFLTGFLVKYKPEAEEEIVVPELHTLQDQPIENRVTAKSRFFLHARSGLIAFHPVGNQISRQLFARRFAEVFAHALQNFFINAEVQAIEEQHKLLDEIRLFTSVRRVSISLHPSNPSSRDIWVGIDRRIKAINASFYRENYESDPHRGSLHVTEDGDIAQKIAMAEDGYGKVDVTGEKEGKLQKISTYDNQMSILAPSDAEPPEQIFPAIREAFNSFLGRFLR